MQKELFHGQIPALLYILEVLHLQGLDRGRRRSTETVSLPADQTSLRMKKQAGRNDARIIVTVSKRAPSMSPTYGFVSRHG